MRECSAVERSTWISSKCSSYARSDVEPAVGDDAALVERIFLGVPQRDELVIALASGKSKPAAQRTVSSAASRAHFNCSARGSSSRRRGAR